MNIILSVFLTGIFIEAVLRLFARRAKSLKFSDRVTGIPRLGGIGLVAVFFMALFASRPIDPLLALNFALVFALGIFDDLFYFNVAQKFIAESMIGVLLILAILKIYPGTIGVFFLIPVFFLIIGMMNALNFLDIADGLAAGVSIISALCFSIVFKIAGNASFSGMSLLLAVSNTAFMFFNYPKAKMYMGEAGSLFNGAVLSCLAVIFIIENQGAGLLTAFSIITLPVLDMIFLIFMRIIQGKPITTKSCDHYILLLKKAGLD
ncbi:MAG TPA: MraY family glycosyltransferase, partial [Candidatus Omnitrophota bacterium]|nr:MraY family glycosyltransferase [Candidatus Omnitrophota bacterium]